MKTKVRLSLAIAAALSSMMSAIAFAAPASLLLEAAAETKSGPDWVTWFMTGVFAVAILAACSQIFGRSKPK